MTHYLITGVCLKEGASPSRVAAEIYNLRGIETVFAVAKMMEVEAETETLEDLATQGFTVHTEDLPNNAAALRVLGDISRLLSIESVGEIKPALLISRTGS